MGDPTVSPLTRRDIAPAGRALARAFQDDPLLRFLEPREAHRRRWLPALHGAHVRMTLGIGRVYGVRDDAGEVAGAICLAPPGTYPPGALRSAELVAGVMMQPTTPPPRLRDLIRGARYVMPLARLHPKLPHWYVVMVGVAPELQGLGAGRALMGRAIDLAEADGLPLYLETQTEKNVRFYESRGFEVVEHLHPHPEGPPSWTMIRRSGLEVQVGGEPVRSEGWPRLRRRHHPPRA